MAALPMESSRERESLLYVCFRIMLFVFLSLFCARMVVKERLLWRTEDVPGVYYVLII